MYIHTFHNWIEKGVVKREKRGKGGTTCVFLIVGCWTNVTFDLVWVWGKRRSRIQEEHIRANNPNRGKKTKSSLKKIAETQESIKRTPSNNLIFVYAFHCIRFCMSLYLVLEKIV